VLESAIQWWELVLRAVVVYLALFAALRISGKRELGQLAIHDLVFVLLVANALQPAITGPDTSLVGGIVIVLALTLLNAGVARSGRLGFLRRVLEPSPTVVIQDGRYVDAALRREDLERDLVDAVIREHGLEDVSRVKLGVLEVDGTISIVPSESGMFRSQRRVRGSGRRP